MREIEEMIRHYEVVVAEPGDYRGHAAGNWRAMPHDDAPNGYTTLRAARSARAYWQREYPDELFAIRIDGERYPL